MQLWRVMHILQLKLSVQRVCREFAKSLWCLRMNRWQLRPLHYSRDLHQPRMSFASVQKLDRLWIRTFAYLSANVDNLCSRLVCHFQLPFWLCYAVRYELMIGNILASCDVIGYKHNLNSSLAGSWQQWLVNCTVTPQPSLVELWLAWSYLRWFVWTHIRILARLSKWLRLHRGYDCRHIYRSCIFRFIVSLLTAPVLVTII